MRKHVQRIERIALLLVGLATVASLVFWDGRIVLGVGVGGALAALNFHALRRIMAAIFNAEGTSGQKQAFTAVLLLFKFGALTLTVFLVVKFAPDGTARWGAVAGGPNIDDLRDVALDGKGNIYATGGCRDKAAFGKTTLKILPDYNHNWDMCLGKLKTVQ